MFQKVHHNVVDEIGTSPVDSCRRDELYAVIDTIMKTVYGRKVDKHRDTSEHQGRIQRLKASKLKRLRKGPKG